MATATIPSTDLTGTTTQPSGPLPATTAQAFKSYLNAHFKGTDNVLGHPLHALDGIGLTGSTIGDQWLKFYSEATVKDPGKTLEQYEEAFVVLAEEGYLGTDLAAGVGGGLAFSGAAVQQVPSGLQNAIPGVAQIGDFFASLGEASTWIRVAEVFLGVVLLGIGIAQLTHTSNVISKAVKMTPQGKTLKKVGIL